MTVKHAAPIAGAVLTSVSLAQASSPTPIPSSGPPTVTSELVPPVAKRVEVVTELFGDKRVDPYAWLRDKPNPEVAQYLEAENAYAHAWLKPTEPLQAALYQEMLGHIKQTDLTVAYRLGKFFYYSRTEQGKQYPIHCRRRITLGGGFKPLESKDPMPAGIEPGQAGPEDVLVDLNELAKGEKFMALGAMTVSDDGNLLAYTTDNTGFRQYTLFVKDLRTGRVLPDRAERVGSVAWAGDNKTIFYTVEDAAKRQYRLYRHKLESTEDDLVYEETDERFRIGVHRSRSRAFVFLQIGSHTTSEVRFIPAEQTLMPWKVVAPRVQDHEYDVDHRGDAFYVRTNRGGRNFRLEVVPVATVLAGGAPFEGWKELIPHRPNVMLSDIDLFANHVVLHERENGYPVLRAIDLRTNESRRIEASEPVYALFGQPNPEFEAKSFRYGYQSFITPSTIYDVDFATGAGRTLKTTEVPNYDKSLYQSERVDVPTADGVRVPVSIVYKKGVKRDGSAPLLLSGYGSYGISVPVTFSGSRLVLLDRGFVFAIAHIRGGGERGKTWHDDGRMLKKKNTFSDFVTVAEALVAMKITSRDRLVIEGGSAGGLLMGAVANMRPDLFAAVVAHVPFVDVLNTMSDPTLPLTVGEYEEWGNPQKKEDYELIRSYCPYTNVTAKAYPAMLVKTSFNDSQVFYHEPAKWVAKLRALKTDRNPLLLVTNMSAGHGGASGRYDALKEIALDAAFMLSRMGIAK